MRVQEYIKKALWAIKEIKSYSQEQIDTLLYESAAIISQDAEVLSSVAVEETGIGTPENISRKIRNASNDLLQNRDSAGTPCDSEASAGEDITPGGVVAALIPAADPTVAVLKNFAYALRGRSAFIACPDPHSKNTTGDTVDLIRDALEKCGAPRDLIQILDEAMSKKTAELIAACDSTF